MHTDSRVYLFSLIILGFGVAFPVCGDTLKQNVSRGPLSVKLDVSGNTMRCGGIVRLDLSMEYPERSRIKMSDNRWLFPGFTLLKNEEEPIRWLANGNVIQEHNWIYSAGLAGRSTLGTMAIYLDDSEVTYKIICGDVHFQVYSNHSGSGNMKLAELSSLIDNLENDESEGGSLTQVSLQLLFLFQFVLALVLFWIYSSRRKGHREKSQQNDAFRLSPERPHNDQGWIDLLHAIKQSSCSPEEKTQLLSMYEKSRYGQTDHNEIYSKMISAMKEKGLG
ncbi:MAG: hypothetical protein HQL32_12115 [Planctomycetes bacterium]|nr:hypothetical protein [Planctomycetota bacterium]